MLIDECFELGYISKPHSFKGHVKAELDIKYPLHFKNIKTVLLLKGNDLTPYSVNKISLNGTKAIFEFANIHSEEQALEIKGCKIFLPLDQLPTLKEDDFYQHELIGLRVTDKSLGELGIINQLYNLPNNDLFSIEYLGCEVLIPFQSPFILKVDRKKKSVLVDLPEGYLDVYTSKLTKVDSGISKK